MLKRWSWITLEDANKITLGGKARKNPLGVIESNKSVDQPSEVRKEYEEMEMSRREDSRLDL